MTIFRALVALMGAALAAAIVYYAATGGARGPRR